MPKKRAGRKFKLLGDSRQPDKLILGITAFLLFFGLILVYDSSAIVASSEPFNDSFHFFKQQVVWIVLGIIAGYIAYRIDYHEYPKIIPIGIIITIFLLVLVLIVGTATHGSKRWLDFGFFTLQPSELAKLVFTIYLASWLSKQKNTGSKYDSALKNYIVHSLMPFLILLLVITSLILAGKDLATTAIVGAIALVIYFISGKDLLHSVGSIAIIITMAVVGVFAAVLAPYRLQRILTYLKFLQTGEVPDPTGSGYQLSQILIAVGSGGLFGVGFGESRQKFFYLGISSFTDTIFAIFAEEFGLFGSIILVLIFLIFILRGLGIARSAPDSLGALLASGIIFWIGLQAFLNISANVGLIPLTGIPLPFISYGGSSMIVTLVAIGILLNISKYSRIGR
ncbi:cell division protein FtsW [Candidatus Dojkabacteria bacterium]|nr:cell division protein FtsW [Candidatus Dojkabacteria bacterium]